MAALRLGSPAVTQPTPIADVGEKDEEPKEFEDPETYDGDDEREPEIYAEAQEFPDNNSCPSAPPPSPVSQGPTPSILDTSVPEIPISTLPLSSSFTEIPLNPEDPRDTFGVFCESCAILYASYLSKHLARTQADSDSFCKECGARLRVCVVGTTAMTLDPEEVGEQRVYLVGDEWVEV